LAEKAKIKEAAKKEMEEIEEESNRSSMKTAAEVINRIEWDADLMPDKFIIGYLDRFLGIQEANYTLFTTHIDYVDVPQHRIRYIKYYEEKVWDRDNQIDNFFGSSENSTTTIAEIVKTKTDLYEQERMQKLQAVELAKQQEAAEEEKLIRAVKENIAEQRRLLQLRRQNNENKISKKIDNEHGDKEDDKNMNDEQVEPIKKETKRKQKKKS